MPNVQCPDPAKAPPRPTTTTQRPDEISTWLTRQPTNIPTTRMPTTTMKTSSTTKTIINGSLTALAGKFAGRPGESSLLVLGIDCDLQADYSN